MNRDFNEFLELVNSDAFNGMTTENAGRTVDDYIAEHGSMPDAAQALVLANQRAVDLLHWYHLWVSDRL